jgi:hypothetical protein
MRRMVAVLFVSFSLSGLWGQLWHALGLSHLTGHPNTMVMDGDPGPPTPH